MALLPACEGGGGACATDPPPEDCAPLYTANGFDDLHARTLLASCASGACHGTYAAKGGLALERVEDAWTGLMTEGRVDPAGCSELLERIDSDDAGWQMPPGHKLSVAERCVIHAWVRAGAPR